MHRCYDVYYYMNLYKTKYNFLIITSKLEMFLNIKETSQVTGESD